MLGNHSKGLPGCFYTLWAGSSPSLPDGSNPSAAIVQSASDVQCSRLLKTTDSGTGIKALRFSKIVLEILFLIAYHLNEFR
ncbi:hypothetical protein FIV35_29115 [Pseudomonas rhodesiae]|nr:hypothetical protein FIV35_29115 [Pseudomonas rhodesiae]